MSGFATKPGITVCAQAPHAVDDKRSAKATLRRGRRQKEGLVSRCFARFEIVIGCMGDGMARLVLLVVEYLCHEIVHFSCMYEIGAA
jgi:hypothetical protein